MPGPSAFRMLTGGRHRAVVPVPWTWRREEERMARADLSVFRRLERRVVSGAMVLVVFFLERAVLRAARKSQ